MPAKLTITSIFFRQAHRVAKTEGKDRKNKKKETNVRGTSDEEVRESLREQPI